MTKKNPISVSDIISIIESYYNGVKPKQIFDEYNIDRLTLDNWLKDYSKTASELLRLKRENEKLAKMYLRASTLNQSLFDALDDLRINIIDSKLNKDGKEE